MKLNGLMVAATLTILMCAGCDTKETPVDQAKDALNIRDHEKLKDAGEDAKDAVENAAEGVEDAVKGKD